MTQPEENLSLAAMVSAAAGGKVLTQEEVDQLTSEMIKLCRARGIPWKPIAAALGVDERTAKAGSKKLAAEVRRAQAAARTGDG